MSTHDDFSNDSDWNLTPPSKLKKEGIKNPNTSSVKKDTRRFRDKWCEIYAPWLTRCPEDPDKPFCKACQQRLDNNGFRLRRHEKTAKHVRNLEILVNSGEAAVLELFGQRKKKKKRPNGDTKIKMETTASSVNTTQDFETIHYEPKFIPKKRMIPKNERASPRTPIEQVDLDLHYRNMERRDMNTSDYFYGTPQPQEKKDSFDMFFDAISATVKTLPPKLAAETKSRVSQLIAEFELRAICEEEAREKEQQSIITIPSGNVVTIDPITGSTEKQTGNGTSVTQYVYSYQPKI